VDVARSYAEAAGIPHRRQAVYVEVDEARARRIADAYEAMKHEPQNPKVKEAYADLIRQTKDQYQALVKAGYEFTFFDQSSDPYKGNPSAAMRDLRANKRMAVYGTYDGYGTEGITGAEIKDNPMLEPTGLTWPDQRGVMHPVVANDLFRAVHDAFGHGLEGASFRARGEENAWQAHVRLFTGPAIAAITSETRGQNSWLNYGPHGERNRTAKLEDTVFSTQKTGLMPDWTWNEGLAPDEGASVEGQRYMPETIQRDVGRNQDFANPPTDTEAVDALSSEKKAKFGAARSIKPGTQVAARIDIPAFLRTGKYVVAVHEPDGAAGGPGKVIGYDTVTRLQNPKFVVKPGVQRIYEGKSAKFPVATVDGKIMADRSIPADLENYVAVGMDPKEHAFFYDKRTDQPVIGGSEAVSVGNTVFVKNPVYGKPEDFRYMPSPDSAMPGAYSFPGGYRALPGKTKGSFRIYGPAGSLLGIASSLDEAQRILRRKTK
jgi:hypothetical protein